CKALLREGHQLAVDARPKHVAGLDVQVGGAAVDRGLDDLLDAARLRDGPPRPPPPPPRARAPGPLLHQPPASVASTLMLRSRASARVGWPAFASAARG